MNSGAGAPAALVTLVLLLNACSNPDERDGASDERVWSYPPAERGSVVDDYHGTAVADPYRWLEDLDSPATVAWVAAENALSVPYLEHLPARAHFERRLTELLDYERFSVPQQRGGRYVYSYNSGREDQDSIWVTSDLAERGRLLIDPLQLSADGTVSVSSYTLSPKGRYLAYGVSDGGSDWRIWRLADVETGERLPDELHGIKFSGVSWLPDGSGFFYSRYPRATDGEGYDDQRQVTIWYHAVGTSQADDVHVFEVTDHPARNPYAEVTDDGRFLIVSLFDGYAANAFYYKELRNGKWGEETVPLLDEWDARHTFLGNAGRTFYFLTVLDAPRGQVVSIDLDALDREAWRTIVPETEHAISSASLVGGAFIVQYMVDAHSVVRVFDRDGGGGADVPLPGFGSVAGFGGRDDDTETFFSYTDFATPKSVYRFAMVDATSTPVSVPTVAADTDKFVTRQVFFESDDGTRVGMYIVHRNDLKMDGRRPTVLYGYGGFNIPIMPSYSSTRMAWLDAGGVYVSVNLRGGGEYGEDWYLAGTRLDKQAVFDDFIAAAQWLQENGITNDEHLAIWGVSNGGLLAAATEIQRPELFAAAIPSVGVLDMLRYHTASANARQWATDYGLSEEPAEFAAQFAYSPYHNLREGDCYPPTLVLADANDDRVLPWHSYKFAAQLQYAQGCDNPVLIRTETRSGHGAGRSLSKNIQQYADQWAFVADRTGLILAED